MAIANAMNPEEIGAKLSEWLKAQMRSAHGVDLTESHAPKSNGLSNETFLFTARWTDSGGSHTERLVARVQPYGPAVHPEYDLEKEFRLLGILHDRTEIPIAKPRWLELDRSVLGSPFMVSARVDGLVPGDDPPYTAAGWFLEMSASDRGQLLCNALSTLAQIHALDWRKLNLGFLCNASLGAPGLDEQIGYLKRAYAWSAQDQPNPTIEAGLKWIEANRPRQQPPLTLSWGDSRIGNMLFSPDRTVAAVLDWELATIGTPEMDVGWWLFLQRHHTQGIGVPLPVGMPDHAETIRIYEQLAGRTLADMAFYEAFAAVRGAIQMHRVGGLMIGAGLVAEGSPIRQCNPANQILAKLLDLPAPTGNAESWIGNR
jgi:aminoglycoside phosphotransferase (APT) family kinase protein